MRRSSARRKASCPSRRCLIEVSSGHESLCVQFLRGKKPEVRQRLGAHAATDIYLCSIVLAELYVGTLRSLHPAENRAELDSFAAQFVCLAFDVTEANVYSRIRYELEAKGTPIGPYDLQIAAIALTHDCTLVTHNVAEFSRVPCLRIEDWEMPEASG